MRAVVPAPSSHRAQAGRVGRERAAGHPLLGPAQTAATAVVDRRSGEPETPIYVGPGTGRRSTCGFHSPRMAGDGSDGRVETPRVAGNGHPDPAQPPHPGG